MNIRELAQEERRELYEWVLAMAYRMTRSCSRADDLTQEAFLRLDTSRPWDPTRPTSLPQHMYGILRSLNSHEQGSDWRRRKVENDAGIEAAALSDSGRSAETRSFDHAEREAAEALATERIAKLKARLAGLPLDLLILDLMTNGVTKRADLVLQTSRSPDEVKTAMARIRRHMHGIVAAERGEVEEVA